MITEEQIKKTLELAERTMRLQEKALPGERYGFAYYGITRGVSAHKHVEATEEQFGLRTVYCHTAYLDREDLGTTLDKIEAQIKEEEDAHNDII